MANWQFHCCLLLSRAAVEAILASHILIVIENYEIKTQGRETPVEADERDGKLNGLRRNVISHDGETGREENRAGKGNRRNRNAWKTFGSGDARSRESVKKNLNVDMHEGNHSLFEMRTMTRVKQEPNEIK